MKSIAQNIENEWLYQNIKEHLTELKTEKLGIPIMAYLEVTTKCNFRCFHCYQTPDFIRNRKDEMTTEEIFSVLDQLADMGSMFLTITGGDPFIRPDFWKIMEYAKKRDFFIILRTNGALITEERAQRLADLYLGKVNISLYGMSEETYKMITGATGSYEKVMHSVESLVKKGVSLIVMGWIFRENFHEFKEYEKFAKKMGVAYELNWNIHPFLDGDKAPMAHRLTNPQLEDLFYEYPHLIKKNAKKEPSDYLCHDSRNLIEIGSNGVVMPCVLVQKANTTPVTMRQKSLKDIFENDPFYIRLRSLRGEHLGVCSSCEANSNCGPCPANFALGSGSLDATTPLTPGRLSCADSFRMKRMAEKLETQNDTTHLSHVATGCKCG